jgi:hypothetical protein
LRKIEAGYQYVIKEKPGAVYTFAIPRRPDLPGYSHAMFFKHGQNRTLIDQQYRGCSSEKREAPGEPVYNPYSREATCPSAQGDHVQSPQSSPSQATQPSSLSGDNGLGNEVRKRMPRVLDSIFR